MKLSVIVPIYNGGKYIENIILNFKKQSFSDCFEVVFIDDGSTDNTANLLSSLGDTGFSYKVLSQYNKGVSVARNAGIEAANGEYISFVDVDDAISTDYVAAFVRNVDTAADVFVFKTLRVKEGSVDNSIGKNDVFTETTNENMLSSMLVNPTNYGVYNLFVKRSFLDENRIRFAEGYKYYEDYDFLYRVFAIAKDIRRSSKILYYYILREGSAMQKFGPERIECLSLLKALIPFFNERMPHFAQKFTKYGISRIYWSIMWQACLALPYSSARKFGKCINMRSHTFDLIGIHNLKVVMTSFLYLICPQLFVVLAKVFGKNRLKTQNSSLSEFESLFSAKKRVLVFGMTKNIGGIESYLMNVYRHLPESIKFDFVVDWERMAYDNEALKGGSEIYYIPAKSKSPIKHLWLFFKTLVKHPEYKTVYFNVLNAGSAFSMIPAFLLRKRIVVHSHNGLDQNMKLHNRFKPLLNKIASEKLACSRIAGDYMFDSSDYTVIKNGINLSKYAFSETKRNETRKKLGLSSDEFVVLHIGRLDAQKNPLFIVDIAKELNGKATLLYVGSGEMESEIKDYAKGMNNIKFLGLQKDTASLYSAADVFLLPSLFEGLPIVGVEAQAADLQLFVSNTVSKELSMTDKVHFLSIKLSAKDWAESIINCDICNRSDTSDLLRNNGYDINNSVIEILRVL